MQLFHKINHIILSHFRKSQDALENSVKQVTSYLYRRRTLLSKQNIILNNLNNFIASMKISISKLNLLTISCAFVSVCLFICSTNRIIVQRTNAMLLAWTFSVTGYRNLGTVCTASVSICFVINPTDRHELHGTYTLFWNKH